MKSKRILALEPYYGGSHKQWIDGFIKHTGHEVHLLTLPAQKWKWRMRGAAVSFAEEFHRKFADQHWDAVLATSMMNLAEFIGLTRRQLSQTKTVYYLHENQLSYPLHPDERIDYHYALSNLISILSSDEVVFNSEFNRSSFLEGLENILPKIADIAPSPETLQSKFAKSHVLAPPVNFDELYNSPKRDNGPPIILWNHRWDRDKKPEHFAKTLKALIKCDIEFRVIVCGEQFRKTPPDFIELKKQLGDRLLHYGYASTRKEYARLLAQSDIVVSTAQQEFFGLSIVEAIYSGAFPILPHRLNYPYLIPSEWRKETLYDADDDLFEILNRTIQRAQKKELPNLRECVIRYGWDPLINQYDALF